MPGNLNICKNCGESLLPSARFCANCGQKDTDGRVGFKSLLAEFLDAVFNIESRTFRTFRALFIPGKLTNEYFRGRHKTFVHPLRILLVMSILLIISMSYRGANEFTNHNFIIRERILQQAERDLVIDSLVSAQTEISTLYQNDTVDQALDSLHLNLRKRIGWYRDSINLNRYVNLTGGNETEWVARNDYLTLSPSEIVKKYNKEGWFNRLVFKQKLKYLQDERGLSAFIVGSISWIAILIMPVIALIIQLFFRKQKRFFIEHLIFSFHLHSFYFFAFSVFLFTSEALGFYGWLLFIAIVGGYLFLALKKVYKERWRKTLYKWLLLFAIYSVLLLGIVISSLLISFLIY